MRGGELLLIIARAYQPGCLRVALLFAAISGGNN
jgi:hypothetical protein